MTTGDLTASRAVLGNVVLALSLGLANAFGCGDEGGMSPATAGAGSAGVSGGTSGSGVAGTTAGTAGESAGTGASGSGAGGSAAAGAGTGAGAGAGSGSAGSGPAEPATPESLFPLAVGDRWTYRVTTTVAATSPCPEGEHATEIVSESMLDGRTAFEAKHVCDALMPDAVRFYAYGSAGMETKRCPGGAATCSAAWVMGLPRMIADQAMFQASDGTRVVRSVGRVTVEAGTFEDCWETRGTDASPLVSVYCPGVGPVAFSQKDSASPPALDYALELIAYDVQ